MQGRSKQIEKIQSTWVGVNGFSTTAASSDTGVALNAAIALSLTTAGNGGTQVVTTVSTVVNALPAQNRLEKFTEGIVTDVTGPNRVLIYTAGTQTKLIDGLGNEVYGRLTGASGTHTLSYFTMVGVTETAYTFGAITSIDFLFLYRFNFAQYPTDAATRVQSLFVGDDPISTGGRKIMELLSVNGVNTFNPATDQLSFIPIPNTVQIIVQGHIEDELAGGAFTRVGRTITWTGLAGAAGYDLNVGDRVVVVYQTLS